MALKKMKFLKEVFPISTLEVIRCIKIERARVHVRDKLSSLKKLKTALRDQKI
jgi:hypothetical protein